MKPIAKRIQATAGSVMAVAIILSATQALALDGIFQRHLKQIKLPPGFHIEVFAEVPGARSLAYAPETATVFVGSTREAVHAVIDKDKNGKAEAVTQILSPQKVPNGIAWHRDYLYVAEQHRITRYHARNFTPGQPWDAKAEVIYDQLPDKSHHGWRYIGFGPNGKLYVAVGSPCNICDPQGIEGTIIRMKPDGGSMEVFARGVRNSVGFDFQPKTGELYFTDNGVDFMGDDHPPCELNAAPNPDLHFGFPYYGGGRERHEDWADKQPPQKTTMPVVEFQAHVAPLGLRFNRGDLFPAEYRHDAFIAQHGSWNRSKPVGYRIMRIKFDENGKAVGKETFAEGWLQGTLAWGRPTDILQLPDGSLLISDDYQGAIYRITYRARRPPSVQGVEPADAEQIARQSGPEPKGSAAAGKFKAATCSTCHGIDGNSYNPPWPSLAGQHAAYIVQQLNAFQSGARQSDLMADPARALSEQDMRDLAAYFAAEIPLPKGKDPVLARRGASVYRGENLSNPALACNTCHGAAGEGNASAGFPALRGQHSAYTAAQLKAYAAGRRLSPTSAVMRQVATRLSGEDIEAVAAFIQALH